MLVLLVSLVGGFVIVNASFCGHHPFIQSSINYECEDEFFENFA